MAYVDTRNAQRNYGTLVVVGAVELAIGAALVAGLAAKFVPVTEKAPEAVNIPLPKPSPIPDARPSNRATDKNTLAPPPPMPDSPFQNSGPMALPSFGPAPSDGEVLGEVAFPTPSPSPSPLAATRPARPKGNPGLWVTTNDYPQSAIRGEFEGVVRFRLAVGSDGRVAGCEVTGSSGYAALDQAACAKLTLRGRFEPASDGSGALVAGSYSGAVRWQLPRD
jgi:protein TonB